MSSEAEFRERLARATAVSDQVHAGLRASIRQMSKAEQIAMLDEIKSRAEATAGWERFYFFLAADAACMMISELGAEQLNQNDIAGGIRP